MTFSDYTDARPVVNHIEPNTHRINAEFLRWSVVTGVVTEMYSPLEPLTKLPSSIISYFRSCC